MIRRLLGPVLVGVLVVGAAGCGIPKSSEVRVDGPGPVGEAGSVNGGTSQPPTRGASGSDEIAFVNNFLSAAAGEANRAYARVRQFIAPEDRDQLQEKQGADFAVNVVRVTGDPVTRVNPQGIPGEEATYSVSIDVQQIGLLRANGTLAPPVATEASYEIKLRGAAPAGSGDKDAGYYVIDPPSVLLLSDEALQQYYRPNAIYFWNSDQTQLVPDQRYLPSAVPSQRWVTEAVGWLTDGPAEWLTPTVTRLPDDARLINNATETDGRWEINMTMSGEDDEQLDRLVTQLAWSLSEVDGPLELKVRNQTRRSIGSAAEHRLRNAAYLVDGGPQRFCVYEGAIRRVTLAGDPTGPDPVDPAANRNVVSAGLSRIRGDVLAALVVTNGRRQQLAVGVGAAPVPISAHSTTHTSIGRPVWLKTERLQDAYGLVVIDDKLHRFDRRGQLAPVPLNLSGKVTAVAAALDGHRIALIVDDRLYVAAVSRTGGVAVGPTREVPTSLTKLSAVDWANENRLAVAGAKGQAAIYEVGVDGAAESPLETGIGAPVTHLAVYPKNPVDRFDRSRTMYEANKVASVGPSFNQLLREDVQDVAAPTDAASGGPLAPFFLF
ncbi:hypothetical protein O7606_13660 [Micromonospora sp. WMMD882]|uniref:LpqB family beta-propeller domain-containing protein n=1 Tax=Micromonospora sp. WMMD882 TaxID=3015151 RepID=UPI00248BA88A|nr:LpqB family beta-propeller domain-containing protein [Micromonospora sp. WMMD882]WBB77344.1 hypothetical protein O7606_13660 [Micromonospora sp. WMMD882]